jgi:hypothetical protein
MARPRVADGVDDLQIWRVAENILNKQSRTADRGWPLNLALGGGYQPSTVKHYICCEVCTRASEMDGLCGKTKAPENGYEI